jgi:anaerobic magnesium-protoporphyrin IX monomethyl ester cyclase
MTDLKKTAIVDLGYFNSLENIDPTMGWHSHGAGILTTVCRNAGLEVDLLSLKYMKDMDEFKAKLHGYDFVAISVMSCHYPVCLEVLQIAKEQCPGVKTIVGGIGVTVDPESFKSCKDIDYIFYGEGEITLPKLLNNPDKYEREVHGEVVEDMDSVPFLDRTLFPHPLERNHQVWGPSPMATILTARGCWFNCAFCQPAERNHYGGKVRRMSPKRVLAELHDIVDKYHPLYFCFMDDHFTFDKEWLNEFIKGYAEIRLPFWAATRADFVCQNPLLFYQLRGVGMEMCSIGFESGSQRILDLVRKGTTVEQNYQAGEIIGKTGSKIYANIMYGFPTETKEEQKDTRRLCIHLEQVARTMISPAYFTPYPGNDLGDWCKTEGYSLIDVNHYTRYGRDKIKGIDYDFLDKLTCGVFDSQL